MCRPEICGTDIPNVQCRCDGPDSALHAMPCRRHGFGRRTQCLPQLSLLMRLAPSGIYDVKRNRCTFCMSWKLTPICIIFTKTHDYGKLSHGGANCTICRLVLFAGIHQNFKQAALPLGMRRGAECTRKAFALHAQSMRLAGDAPDDSQHETTKRALTRRTECGHVRRISVACAGKLTVAFNREDEFPILARYHRALRVHQRNPVIDKCVIRRPLLRSHP